MRFAVTRLAVATVLIATCLARPVNAQDADPRSPAWSLTPFIGAVGGSDLDATSPSGGLAVALRTGRWTDLEIEGAFVPNLRAETTQPETDAILGTGSIIVSPWLTRSRAVYALVGVTLARLLSQRLTGAGGGRAALEVGFAVGGGGRVALASRLALRADLRFFYLDNAPNLWRVYGGLAITVGSPPRSRAGDACVPARAAR